ncbi:hypothetical protein NMU03_01565 [Allocoprobacillus halotolerans]|uniref:Uncharacterized protein n=1 Tax=Allocoprobacillus halotolerans TaxID=2944914 RepID=A0ABY5I2F9_9FIRM|nr:hypothetical protein [Allocoprobacillus halotolerans]UTY39551.1 hypothetical protein NMU03_01565 [Allocoprobacillus halotolerans]
MEYFKKREKKEIHLQITLENSYHYLGSCQDDTWAYIKESFEKRIHQRHHHDFFERYYQSYLMLAQNHDSKQGTIKDLTHQEKALLIFRTITNTIKNIVGAFSMPIYISLAILIFYYQNFQAINDLRLKTVLDVIPFGHVLYSCLDFCYDIVCFFPISNYYATLDLEFAMMISFCICMTFLWALYTILKTRIREIKRQYLRRIQFYLKKHEGIYDENQKYPAIYLYGVQFTIFVFFICMILICLLFL